MFGLLKQTATLNITRNIYFSLKFHIAMKSSLLELTSSSLIELNFKLETYIAVLCNPVSFTLLDLLFSSVFQY